MSRVQTFAMPDVGEGLTEAEILSWHVAVGDLVAVNQVFVEIETAKAAVELPSPYAGRVHALLVDPGVTVAVGTPIIAVDTDPDGASATGPDDNSRPGSTATDSEAAARPTVDPETARGTTGEGEPPAGAKIGEAMADGRIATLVGYVTPSAGVTRRLRRQAGAGASAPATPQSQSAPATPQSQSAPATPQSQSASAPHRVSDGGPETAGGPAPKAAPPVRKLAKELGVDLREVVATRADGVITRAEVAAAHGGGADGLPEPAPGGPAGPARPGPRETRVPIKGVRKATATAMVRSAFTAPHVTEFLAVDVTEMMNLRERLKKRPEFAEVRVTPLAFTARAVCLAIGRTPEVNASWDADSSDIVLKHYVNLGFAAATPRGLVVPVVPEAGAMGLAELAAALADLTATARAGRTTPAAMTGGTFTITNVGVFGVDTGTPIINPGESAILALGSIKDAPWVVDGQLAVRKVCQLALSFDHRVVDGAQGSAFLADVGALLADPGLAMTF